MSDPRDELVWIVRRFIEADEPVDRYTAIENLKVWLREHDAREDVRMIVAEVVTPDNIRDDMRYLRTLVTSNFPLEHTLVCPANPNALMPRERLAQIATHMEHLLRLIPQ